MSLPDDHVFKSLSLWGAIPIPATSPVTFHWFRWISPFFTVKTAKSFWVKVGLWSHILLQRKKITFLQAVYSLLHELFRCSVPGCFRYILYGYSQGYKQRERDTWAVVRNTSIDASKHFPIVLILEITFCLRSGRQSPSYRLKGMRRSCCFSSVRSSFSVFQSSHCRESNWVITRYRWALELTCRRLTSHVLSGLWLVCSSPLQMTLWGTVVKFKGQNACNFQNIKWLRTVFSF